MRNKLGTLHLAVTIAFVLLQSASLSPSHAEESRPHHAARVIAIGDGRISVLSPRELSSGDVLVLSPPETSEDCGLLRIDRVSQAAPDRWVGSGRLRPGTFAVVGDSALLSHDTHLPIAASCRSRIPAELAPQAARPVWPGVNRTYAKLRVHVGLHKFGWDGQHGQRSWGLIAELGAEANTSRGLRIGFELGPASFVVERPFLTARFHLGYTSSTFAVSLGIANGSTWYYPQIGPLIRIGRLDASYALLQMSWSTYPPRPVPADLDLDVFLRTSRRTRAHLNIGGGYGSVIGVFATLGGQILLRGSGMRGTTQLGGGAGVGWVGYDLGPMLLTAIEHRF